MFFFVFCFLFFGFFGDREMYRKNGRVACKNRAKGWGWVLGYVWVEKPKNRKNFSKCLIFNGLMLFGILFGSFSVAFRWLFGVWKTFDFQRFANIKQVLDFQRFYASLRCGGGVFCMVQSKGAKVWCPVWCPVRCKAMVLSKDKVVRGQRLGAGC